MNKHLFLSILLAGIPLFLQPCHAQDRKVLTQAERKDVANFVEKVKAQLPSGWSVEYRAKGSKLKDDPFPHSKGLAYDLVEVTRLEKTKMRLRSMPNMSIEDLRQSVMEPFDITFEVKSFLSRDEYAKAVAKNQNIRKQLEAKRQILNAMKVNRKFDSYIPQTPEQKIMVKQYEELKKQLVSLPGYYFQGISLDYWWNGPNNFYRVYDKTIRLECALVTQKVDSLLTSYTGEKFQLNEEALNIDYLEYKDEPEPEEK